MSSDPDSSAAQTGETALPVAPSMGPALRGAHLPLKGMVVDGRTLRISGLSLAALLLPGLGVEPPTPAPLPAGRCSPAANCSAPKGRSNARSGPWSTGPW